LQLQRYRLKRHSEIIVSGRAIGQRAGGGPVRLVKGVAEINRVQAGDVIVTDMTDPDWEPVMKRASAVVTNRGGRTCHAAIVARELGIPAVVGCGNATAKLADNQPVTVSCAEGDTGNVYRGLLEIEVIDLALDKMPQSPVKIAMNVGNPELAFEFRRLPNEGVGLARLEFLITRMIGVHPKAVLAYPKLPAAIRAEVERRAAGYADPVAFYVEKLVEGIATLAAAFWPKPVIVRLSDFKSNEYAGLTGGVQFEPKEENPMIGFRGASRYIAESFRDCFELECRALKKVRDGMGLTNVEIMVPFVRTVGEGQKVLDALAANGLRRGDNGVRVIMMCEIPSNAVLAAEFLELFDGFSIGTNDMTQLTLGLDRDSGIVAGTFDERDPAVKYLLHLAIQTCRAAGKYIGICGQGPSDHPDFAWWLVEEGIEVLSLNPDTVVETWLYLAREAEKSSR
jgi:pyruvate,water dikinase